MPLPAARAVAGLPAVAGERILSGEGKGGFAGVAERTGLGLQATPPVGKEAAAEAAPASLASANATAPDGRREQTVNSSTALPSAAMEGSSVTAEEGDRDAQSGADPGGDTGAEAQVVATLSLPAQGNAEPAAPLLSHRPVAEAPVQLWRLREQARPDAGPPSLRQQAQPDAGTRPEPRLPELRLPELRMPEANALLLQRLGGGPLSRPDAAAGQAAYADPTAVFATALAAVRTAPAGSHEWAPVSVQSGDKAAIGEQLLLALKDKVELQLNQRVQQARIKLDPPEMGRMELTVRLEGERLHVQINASHAGLRDAITAQADRLRQDLLAQHGGGVEVNVGQQDRQDSAPRFHDDIHIGAASAEPGDDNPAGAMGLGWINALA
ncbi:LafE [Oceanimonas sp. GK1]|uniref:flagellar hook-length control protein FliK n=1 Tax=Oceanimonas sp. (strain GK1 / IBRC-M 10197) TaxID=511062 RepID=UPI0002495680|nr:flagellar hook-length control protein FliK [Oceanimonas sp. GK1]AEY02543.1 LafE [Oceanimonas sp. GK1]